MNQVSKNGERVKPKLFTINERTKPQQYFPSCIKATIIEKKNGLIDPTGANYNNKAFISIIL